MNPGVVDCAQITGATWRVSGLRASDVLVGVQQRGRHEQMKPAREVLALALVAGARAARAATARVRRAIAVEAEFAEHGEPEAQRRRIAKLESALLQLRESTVLAYERMIAEDT